MKWFWWHVHALHLQPQRTVWQNQVCLLCPLKNEHPEIKPNCPMFHSINHCKWTTTSVVHSVRCQFTHTHTHTHARPRAHTRTRARAHTHTHKKYNMAYNPHDLHFQQHTLSDPPGDMCNQLRHLQRTSIHKAQRPASSSGQGFWLLIMRSQVRLPALPWEFFLVGEDPHGDHGLGS